VNPYFWLKKNGLIIICEKKKKTTPGALIFKLTVLLTPFCVWCRDFSLPDPFSVLVVVVVASLLFQEDDVG
jgi:hypothetical protein